MILLHLDFLSALLYAAVFLFMIFRAGMLNGFGRVSCCGWEYRFWGRS